MKTKFLISLIIVGFMSMTNYACVQAQNTPSDKQVFVMLKEFYTTYITESSKSLATDNLDRIFAIQKKYCTVSLLNKINAQFKSGQLEADPFLQAQDIDVSWLNTLSFNKDSRRLNGYRVSYFDSVANEKVVIHLTVVNQDGKFKISAYR
ncbi:MAG: YbjP/YqhG family protein [Bacteroidota bacterium]|nr:YbjP/YqhG family protein [Bacteroidota bacterium]